MLAMPARPPSTLSLMTWNIDFSSILATRRTKGLIDYICSSETPDILFLQEVRADIHASLLANPQIRQKFLITDAEDQSAFSNSDSFTNIVLLAKDRFAFSLRDEGLIQPSHPSGYMIGSAFREKLPSAFGRNGFHLDLIPQTAPGKHLRLINTHLDSLQKISFRSRQLKQLTRAFNEDGCIGGLIAGDFNAIQPEDDRLIAENNLEDAWLSLKGYNDPNAPTWSVGRLRDPRYPPGRLDKVATSRLIATRMEVVNPGSIEVPRPGDKSGTLEWSDHSGLKCHFRSR